ncbi:HNH endonuclease signature motif containing protein [Yimella sp. RIT 621]|uniref:HNH endonuclease n=1 Tax=Yimella sp. RIT 621 TaxID=2510323 RepID=UPI001F0F8ADF|nr:HNH endonuclease signature motif containing protein [Yimella sp. RIT 621]
MLETTSYPGEAAECASAVSDVLASVERLASVSSNLTDVELTATAQSLVVMMQQAEASLVALTADAIGRGVIDRSTAADTSQWVQRLSTGEPVHGLLGAQTLSVAGPLVPVASASSEPTSDPAGVAGEAVVSTVLRSGIEPAHAARISKLADACRSPLNQVLADAVCTASVNTTIAKTALDNIDKVKSVLPTADRGEVFSWFLGLEPGSGAKAVHELTKRIMAAFGDEVLDDTEDAVRPHESLTWMNLPEGMVRLIADLSPDHAEIVKHAIGALSAPAPVTDCCDEPNHRHNEGAAKTGEPDTRSPGKRRADALLTLIAMGAQGIDGDGSIKTFGSARLVVTIDYEVLAKALAGLGVTDTGVGVTPDTIRQLACDAEIIPMVLGSKSQPLDVGRKVRLVDKELRRTVIQRDKHCTYDGCTRPPVMCEVHHVVAWWAGGETSLNNSALLCTTHHRIVHRDHLTATVTDNAVTWHHHKNASAA